MCSLVFSRFAAWMLAGFIWLATASLSLADLPATGAPVAGMEPMDQAMQRILARWDGTGGSVAVVKDGQLIYARAFGYADPATNTLFQPLTVGRVGSISKCFTSTTIMRLVEQGRLSLDARVFGPGGLLGDITVPAGADVRLYGITLRHLLTMSAGWDPAIVGDAAFPPLFWRASTDFGLPLLPTRENVAAIEMGLPLEANPGAAFVYANSTPIILGLIVERATGRKYAEVIQTDTLAPIGIQSATVATLRRSERRADEAVYQGFGLDASSIYPGEGEVPQESAYGLIDLPLIAPSGGWVCSAVDLARFMAHLNGQLQPALVRPETYALMTGQPAGVATWNSASSYWFGYQMEIYDGGRTKSKYGALPGAAAWVADKGNGYIVAVIFNSRNSRLPDPEAFPNMGGSIYDEDIRAQLDLALKQVAPVAPVDLFPIMFPPGRPAPTHPRLASGTVGQPFAFQLSAVRPETIYAASNLPSGLVLNPSTQRVEGVPVTAGSYVATTTAYSATGQGSFPLQIEIVNPATPVVSGAGVSPASYQNLTDLGRRYDQVLMTGPEVSVAAQGDRSVRVAFIDSNDDIVQAELSGPGTLTVQLSGPGANRPARATKYNVPVDYVKGEARFALAGATPETTFRYYALGRVNAPDYILRPGVTYDGIADATSLSITGTGLQEIGFNNARLTGSSGLVGIDAGGIAVARSLQLGGLAASGSARPILYFGSIPQIEITSGSDLTQPNRSAVFVSGLRSIVPGNGGEDANGFFQQPVPIHGPFFEGSVDVTKSVVDPEETEPVITE